jgi:hypothetical protein
MNIHFEVNIHEVNIYNTSSLRIFTMGKCDTLLLQIFCG